MTPAPEWVRNFLQRARKRETPFEVKPQPPQATTENHRPVFAPYCPAKLGDRADIHEIPYGDQTLLACGLYEKNRTIGFSPSPEFCPKCRYNPDNIEAKADTEVPIK